MFSSQSSGAVNNAINQAVNVVANAATGAANAATDLFSSVTNAGASAANSISQNMPSFNSLIPLGNTTSPSSNNAPKNNAANAPKNNAANAPKNNAANAPKNNAANAPKNNAANAPKNNGIMDLMGSNKSAANNAASFFSSPALYIFIGLVVIFALIFSLFNDQIKLGYQYISSEIKTALGYPPNPSVTSAVTPVMPEAEVTMPPEAPQDMTPSEMELPQQGPTSFIERILPSDGNEVFNVAQNKFTYYDAEPLCNALGAELATYEQVKQAWGAGADWCNYGWVKGQMAVYPTQKDTYEKLQAGPADQRGACGTVGLNGGYFDNPEFKYGVNCYGKKPSQSAHDQQELMAEGKAPRTPETLKVDAMVREFREEADSLFVKPYNNQKWSAN